MKRLKEMKKPCIRALSPILSLILVVSVMLASVPQPVLAEPTANLEAEYTKAINTLERFLSISETGNIVLNAPKGVVRRIDPAIYQSLLSGLAQTNSMINSGYLVANPDFTLTVAEKYLEFCSECLEPNSGLIASIPDPPVEVCLLLGETHPLCGGGGGGGGSGITDVRFYWWGLWVYFSDAFCDLLVYLMMTTGITASGLAAWLGLSGIAIPAAKVAVLVAVLSSIGAATLDYVNRNDTGIRLRIHLIPKPVPPYLLPILTYLGPQ